MFPGGIDKNQWHELSQKILRRPPKDILNIFGGLVNFLSLTLR